SGYGSSGPYRDKKAYDLLVQAEAGVISINGSQDAPAKIGLPVADLSAGMYAYTGILTALYSRERTGEGSAFEVSMFEALGEWMGFALYYTAYGGVPPARTGASHALVQPYGPFTCGDGKSVFLGVQNSREWVRFCQIVLDSPETATDQRFNSNSRRVTNRDLLTTLINERFARLTMEEVISKLDHAGIANAHLNSVQEFWDHAQHKARNRWREVESEAGPLKALLPPVTARGAEPRMDPIPSVGEHTENILRSLGRTDEDIRRLRAEAAI
ncbi:MAG: CaiB/BaiF CoA-transferase family protein, partial [Chloroflexia bacterium]